MVLILLEKFKTETIKRFEELETRIGLVADGCKTDTEETRDIFAKDAKQLIEQSQKEVLVSINTMQKQGDDNIYKMV